MRMRRTYLTILMMAVIAMAATAGYPEGYYDRMDGKKREALKTAAKQCVS